jgi:predicted AAA+ superfamily ATPase
MITEIIKWFYNHGKIPNLYFWQDKTGHEIDCLVEEGSTIIPIEMKAGRTTSSQFFQGLSYWNALAQKNENNGYVVYGGSAGQSRGSNQVVSWQNVDTILKTIA